METGGSSVKLMPCVNLFDFDQKWNIFTLLFCLVLSAVALEYVQESIYYMRKNKNFIFLNFNIAFFV